MRAVFTGASDAATKSASARLRLGLQLCPSPVGSLTAVDGLTAMLLALNVVDTGDIPCWVTGIVRMLCVIGYLSYTGVEREISRSYPREALIPPILASTGYFPRTVCVAWHPSWPLAWPAHVHVPVWYLQVGDTGVLNEPVQVRKPRCHAAFVQSALPWRGFLPETIGGQSLGSAPVNSGGHNLIPLRPASCSPATSDPITTRGFVSQGCLRKVICLMLCSWFAACGSPP